MITLSERVAITTAWSITQPAIQNFRKISDNPT